MQILHPPAIPNEPRRQPVQQLRMRWWPPQCPEVTGILRQSSPEVRLPDPVHNDAGSQGILSRCEPPRKGGAPPRGSHCPRMRLRRNRKIAGIQQRKHPGQHLHTAFGNHSRRGLITNVRYDKGRGRTSRSQLVKGRQLATQCKELLLVFALDPIVKDFVLVIHLPPCQMIELLFQRRALLFSRCQNRLQIRGKHLDGFTACLIPPWPLKRVDPTANPRRRFLPHPLLLSMRLQLSRGGHHRIIDWKDPLKEGTQPVIVLLQNRIKLMIVAAGTLHSKSQKDVTRGIRHFVENQIPLTTRVAIVVLINPVPQKSRSDQGIRVLRKQFIPGQLFLHKLVIRFVLIQTLNHIIPVPPGIRAVVINSIAIRICIPNNIQPVPRPTLTVTITGQQSIHHAFPGIRPLIRHELLNLRSSRWQSRQIKCHPTNQYLPVRFRSR